MSKHMKDAGHAVRGFDIDPNACKRARELGIEVVDSIAAAVAAAEVVFTMVPAGPDVKQVLTAKGWGIRKPAQRRPRDRLLYDR